MLDLKSCSRVFKGKLPSMSEDTQLICSLSIEDPYNIWKSQIESTTSDKLPLQNITIKNPRSNVFITISKFPIRFIPSSSSLFKDTNHPFRWFLAPYVNIYICRCDSYDAYNKTIKAMLHDWLENKIVDNNNK